MELRRRSLLSRDYELFGDDAQLLAQVRLRAFREAGAVETSDGRRWEVRRDPNFGPWQVTAAGGGSVAGGALVTVTKEGLRERFSVVWATGGLRLERRSSLGRRRMEVLDAATGAAVGGIRQVGWTARTFELDLPAAPDEAVGAVAWVVAMLAQRDAAVAAQS